MYEAALKELGNLQLDDPLFDQKVRRITEDVNGINYGYARCARCGYEKVAGQPCGEPCV